MILYRLITSVTYFIQNVSIYTHKNQKYTILLVILKMNQNCLIAACVCLLVFLYISYKVFSYYNKTGE